MENLIFSFNYLQRLISALAFLLLLAIVLFPHWVEHSVAGFEPYLQHDRGRAFVFWPPEPSVVGNDVRIDWLIALLNGATIVVAWAAFTISLRGKFKSIQEHISNVRLPLAVTIGGIAPVPPFVVPHTYLPNFFFVLSAFADTGHVPSSSILGFGLLFWCAYSALVFALLWLFGRIKKPTEI
jgi:hypothetical protein